MFSFIFEKVYYLISLILFIIISLIFGTEKKNKNKNEIIKKFTSLFSKFNKTIQNEFKKDLNLNYFISEYNKIDQSFINVKYYVFGKKIKVSSDTKIFSIGDIHQEGKKFLIVINKLIDDGILNDSLVIQGDNYLILTGDFFHRGETLFLTLKLLFLLKINNPEKVIILRGNHETLSLLIDMPDDQLIELFKIIYPFKLLLPFYLLPSILIVEFPSGKKIHYSHGAIDRDVFFSGYNEGMFDIYQEKKLDNENKYIWFDLLENFHDKKIINDYELNYYAEISEIDLFIYGHIHNENTYGVKITKLDNCIALNHVLYQSQIPSIVVVSEKNNNLDIILIS